MSYHCIENSYMITIAVQIQLQHFWAPKWRPSSTLAKIAKNWSQSSGVVRGRGGGGNRRRPAPLIAFIGGWCERGRGRGRARRGENTLVLALNAAVCT